MGLMDIIGAFTKPISDGFTAWNDGRVRIKEAKINAQVARYNAEARLAEKEADAERDWDMEALKQQENSWRDEYLTILLSLPLIGSFIPDIQDHVVRGWEYLQKAPLWYQLCFMGVVAATFGLRWWFNRNKFKVMGG